MTNTPQNLKDTVNSETEKLKIMNAEIDSKFAEYLKPDYKPKGGPSSELNEKVKEAGYKKEQEDMADELDKCLIDIFAGVADLKEND